MRILSTVFHSNETPDLIHCVQHLVDALMLSDLEKFFVVLIKTHDYACSLGPGLRIT